MKSMVFNYLKRIVRFIVLTVISAIVTTLIASIISTQRVLSSLNDLGAGTPLSDRISMTLYDAQHFGSMYGIFVLLGLLVAFLVGGDLGNRFPKLRLYLLIGAGMVAIYVMLYLMRQVFFGVPIVAGARDGLGLFLQMIAGGVGGFVFYLLTKSKMPVANPD